MRKITSFRNYVPSVPPPDTSIRNVAVLVLGVSYFAAVYVGQDLKLKLLIQRVFVVSKRFFGVPSFFNYAIADGAYNLLCPDKTALRGIQSQGIDDFHLKFEFGQKLTKPQSFFS